MGLPEPLLGAAWPSISGDFLIPLHYASYAFTIIGIGRFIANISCDRMVKRFGTGTVSLFGFLFLTAGVFGFYFSSTFLLICLWSFFIGLGPGYIDVALNFHVAVNYKARHMNWLHCFWGIGASIGPMIMSFYLKNNNLWNLGYRNIGIILCSFIVVLVLTLPLWTKNEKRNVENNADKTLNIDLMKIKGVKTVLFVFICFISLEIIVVIFGSSFLVLEKKMFHETAAQCISLFYLGMTAGRLLSGFITIFLGNSKIIRMGFGVIAFGLITLILARNNNVLMTCFFILGFGNAPLFPCLLHETPKNFGYEKSQAIMGLQLAGATIGSLLTIPLFGLILSNAGLKFFTVFIGVLLITTVLLFELFSKKIQRTRI